MKASRFISERLDFRGRITVVATAVSFFVIVLSLLVVDGFRRQIRDGISSLMGDVQLTATALTYYGEGEPVDRSADYFPKLLEVDGVREIVPAIYRTAVIKSGGGIQGVLMKAEPGFEEGLTVSIPASMSDKLGLGVGDEMLAYFVGDKVKVRKFKVREVYRDLLKTDDRMVVYAGLNDLQRVNGWDSTKVSAFEVRLADKYRTPEREKAAAAGLSMVSTMYAGENDTPLVATASSDRYARLFDWMNLLDFNVAAILLLMTLVAGFNMISGLLIMLFRHTGTIGTLKALGMDGRGITEAFLRVAGRVVLKGMAIGNGVALLFALIQGTTHLIKLNPVNYFVSYVPVWVNIPKILLVNAAAYATIMLLMLLPSLFIVRVDPSDTVRVK